MGKVGSGTRGLAKFAASLQVLDVHSPAMSKIRFV